MTDIICHRSQFVHLKGSLLNDVATRRPLVGFALVGFAGSISHAPSELQRIYSRKLRAKAEMLLSALVINRPGSPAL